MSKNLPILAIPATLNVSELMTVRGGANPANPNSFCLITVAQKETICISGPAEAKCDNGGAVASCPGDGAIVVCTQGPAITKG